MAICSRRTLQRLINENAKFLTRKQVRTLVDKLNKNDVAASKGQKPNLATEWEIILCNVFSKLGTVEYERTFGGRRYPDLHFLALNDPNQFFTADITAISDNGYKGLNPFDALFDELMERVGDRRLRQNSFSLQVEGNHEELYREGPKAKLKLPSPSRFKDAVFNQDFDAFLESIARSQNEKANYRVLKPDENIDLTIEYDPKQPFASGAHLSYKMISKLTDNIVYSRLQEKRTQLLEAISEGPIAIILCDGGFEIFNSAMRNFAAHSVSDVIKQFLLDHRDVDFILTFSVEQTSKRVLIQRYGTDHFYQKNAGLIQCLDKLIEVFPEVEMDPVNAMNHLSGANPRYGRSYWGGLRMSAGEKRTSVAISARALTELLAGKVSQNDFFERHGFIPSEMNRSVTGNPFEIGFREGQLIDEISLKKTSAKDDDWIVFTLRGPDPAISPFVLPDKD